MSIGKNIKKLRNKHNMSQKEFGEIAGVSDKAVSTWEKGLKEPRMGAIQKIADHFGILKSDIIEDQDSKVTQIRPNQPKLKSNCKEVPLLGAIAAGIPLEMIQVEEWINIPIEVADRYPNAFLVKVIGDSMNKVIPSNALALIDPDSEIKNGDITAVAVNGFDATLKRFYKFQDGITLEPESYNPEHKTQFYDSKTQEHTPVVVKGKLVWYMAPLNVKF
ncbi:helix-turn-helix domain-containing protein (plasmid) [Bacillus cytotoxicus]|uniref:LexA repressor n=1 Tax=Bacillus cytotoxicus TaxID=580165 RepID=A0AAX2CNR3_9BACI|nr:MULTISPECIES: S24 family peptidase [Bacillus cereus group]MDH2882457.1 helix-turn-helix domain-containing protein [Bacillus cytotoxicus]QTR81136.1 helix-turn-helix domain-containing protein [Bacillus cytotoxicus]QTR87909.1 helix-turn-helix domain-containing protein [Bacillus cytotoxicus]SCM08419.1 LexA repressor [Bacillus cytotoxicus]HDR4573319.1 helix-turn-helix domain-containing protein [Bacillus cytotoxicus]